MMVLVGVVGPGACSPDIEALAYQVGYELASRGAGIVCGGLGGVMEAACRGARAADGVTIGILPGTEARDANPYVVHPIVTGLGEARNVVVVRTARCLVAVGGEYGTLSEVAFALKLGVPVVGLGTWELEMPATGVRAPIEPARDASHAARLALARAAGDPRDLE